jgi:membrane protein DedA with SNARE-associated domain
VAALLLYLGLGVLLTAEEAGIFLLPGDISLVAVGVQFGIHGEPLFAIAAWIIASLAMVAGATALFHGVNQSQHSSHMLPRRVRTLVRRHHVWGVAVARMVPGLRNATVFAAASAGLRYRTFVAGLIPAAFLWSGILLALGWFGGSAITATLTRLDSIPAIRWTTLVLFVAAVAFAFFRLRAVRKQHDREAMQSRALADACIIQLDPLVQASGISRAHRITRAK